MNEYTDCLLLKSQDYRESDSILTVLSKEYGRLSFVARGLRKVSSKNARHTQLYTESRFLFDYREGKTMFALRTAETVTSFRHLRDRLESSVAASLIAEAVCALIVEGEKVNGLYELCRLSLELLNQGENADTVLAAFLAELLELLGFSINVDSCAICGKPSAAYISVEDGGFLCRECCEKTGKKPMDREDLKRFRFVVKGGLSNFDVLKQAGGAKKEDLKYITAILRLHAGAPLHAYELYKRL